MRDALQSLMGRPTRMVFALIANVFDNPRQIARAEADDSVPRLSLQHLRTKAHRLIHVVRAASFELSDKLTDQ